MQSTLARLRAALSRLAGLARRDTLDARLREEIAFHIEMETRRNVGLGYSAAEARRRALVTFGGRERTSDDARDQLRSRIGDELLRDVRFALRGMRRSPGFALTVVITLALGIGANATMFGLVDRLMLEPPAHVADPGRLFVFNLRYGPGSYQTSQPYGVVTALKPVHAFASVTAATSNGSRRQYFPLGRGSDGMQVAGGLVGGNYFTTLGVHPAVGRFFLAGEETLDHAAKLAVLGYGFWQSHFGGRRDAIGQTLDIGTDKYTVVGVAPRGFTGTELSDVDVWLPVEAADGLRFARGADWATNANAQWINVLARLAPGVSAEHAASQATVAFRAWMAEHLDSPTPQALAELDSETVVLGSILPSKPLPGAAMGPRTSEIRVSELLAAVAVVVLILACANVANLLLLRALQRRREIAVRLALGVTRRRLVMQLLVEGFLLTFAGAVGALCVAAVASGIVRRWLLADLAWSGGGVDMRVLAFTTAAALFTGLATSLVPALQASRPSLTGSLKAGARDGVAQRSRTRTGLLVVQAALAIVLLAGAGLFTRSLRNADSLDLGMDVDHTIVAHINHNSTGLNNAQALQLYEEFERRAIALPGVKAAAISIAVPFGMSWGVGVSTPDWKLPSGQQNPYQYVVTPGYFDALGMHLLAGRGFTESDRAGAAPVAIVSETMARRLWPGRPAVGQCMAVGDKETGCGTTVVGVVNDTHRQDLVESAIMQVYRPLDQMPASYTDRTVGFFGYTLVVGARGDANSLIEPLRRAIQGASTSVPYASVRTMREALGSLTRTWYLGARVFTAFGALALVLAGIGLFSVVAFTVRQRRHEFGIRTALGAEPGDLLRLTVTRGLAPVVAGIVVGIGLALLAGRFVEALLFNVSARDPMVLGAASGTLLVCAVAASLVPAIRASRADPTIALRAE